MFLNWDYEESSSDDDGRVNRRRLFTPPPKRAKAFARELTPTPTKSVDLMGTTEQKRMTEHYVHPTECCKKLQCWRHFEADEMRSLRHRVWTSYGKDAREKKVEIARIRTEVLKVGGKLCCIKFLKAVFNVSNTFVYGDNRKKPKLRDARATEAIISFFHKMRAENDKMPDRPEYQLYCKFKKDVWRWYQNQPSGYFKCSESFFYRTWKEVAPDCKLRKFMRFAKCKTCEELRSVCSLICSSCSFNLVLSLSLHCSSTNVLTLFLPN